MKKYFYATFIVFLYIPAVTIGAELVKPLKDFLKATFWHHWLGKSVMLIALYIVAVLLCSRIRSDESEHAAAQALTWAFVLSLGGARSIFLFFTYEYATHA